MAVVPTAPTISRRLNTKCVTNFYPIHFQGRGTRCLQIRIFHCHFYDVDADEAIRPREETELKRRIFEAPRAEGRQRDIEDALGIRGLEFGGDCAAGLQSTGGLGTPWGLAQEVPDEAPQPAPLVIDDVDRYEAKFGGDWLPAVIRDLDDSGSALVELYAPGSFWSEVLHRTGPFKVPQESLRPRQWEVYRGEVLRVPENEVLKLRDGQHLWVRSRGPGHDEPAGRLSIGLGAGVRCEGGTVENEGVVDSIVRLQHPQQGCRCYKVELENIKTLLVDCTEGVPDLPVEERSVVLQCFTWIFERAYRHMQMRTLGGRGWYLAEEGETYPRQQPSSSCTSSLGPGAGGQGGAEDEAATEPAQAAQARRTASSPANSASKQPGGDRVVPPRVFLYRGFAVTAVQVASGPCLKVDLSVRMIQGQTALAKLNFFRDLLIQKHQSSGLPAPSKEDTDKFLQLQMAGRTCMTRHNHIHYRISRVCIDMDPLSTFSFEEGEITYMEYFQRRHGISLQRRQPLLHCPFRGKQELYLPAELAFLTGLDEEWKADKDFAQELWRGLRQEPREHWRLQARLAAGLAAPAEGLGLQDWGLCVAAEPLRATSGQMPQEPVFFSRLSEEYFRRALRPPPVLEVPTSRLGFDRRPWPELWLPRGGRLHLDRWLLFCSAQAEEREAVDLFLEELEPLVGQLLENDRAEDAAAQAMALAASASADQSQSQSQGQSQSQSQSRSQAPSRGPGTEPTGGTPRLLIAPPEVVEVPANTTAGGWVDFLRAHQPPWPREQTSFALLVIPDKVRRRDQYYFQLKDLLSFQSPSGLGMPSQMVLSSTIQRTSQRQQIWKNIIQQVLIKKGAWLWVISPLPYRGRSVMVLGIDACRQSRDSHSILTICSSMNPYFTSYYTTWQTQDSSRASSEISPSPGGLVKEAVLQYFRENGRLPDTVVAYRAGVSESQEVTLLEWEVSHPSGGLLEALYAAAQQVSLAPGELQRWRARLEVAFILVRRGTNARFRTEDYDNLPSGTFIDDCVVTGRDESGDRRRFDFYMVSQTYIVGTAKPTLYSVLHNNLSLTRHDIMQLTHRLCAVYMTFSGMVSMPAPLKYAAKLLSLLSRCDKSARQSAAPPAAASKWKRQLFFV